MQSISALFANAGTATEPGSPLINAGYIGNDQPTASNINFYLKLACQAAQEISNIITDAGFTPDVADFYQLEKALIANRHEVGDTIVSSISQTPISYPNAKSTLHPEYPKYNPIISRHDADHDISTAQVPQWVIDKLNAEKITFGAVSSFTATLASGVWTFAAGSDNDKILNLINEMGLVNRWYGSGEAANYGASGALHTGTRQYCLTDTATGISYAITACSTTGRTMTTDTAPANGTYTIEFGINRIAGSTTSARLRRISGEAIVAAGDVTGEVVVGGARMGRILPHQHSYAFGVSGSFSGFNATGVVSSGNMSNNTLSTVGSLNQDGSTTITTGKSNDPRTAGMAVYTFLAVVLATNWT
jgi:hypothetical protein